MSLAAAMLRATLDSGKAEIGLALNGAELRVSGYQRRPATRWEIADGLAQVDVVFGPFLARAEFNEGLLFLDGEMLRAMPTADGGTDSVGPGSEFGYRATITAEDD